MSGPNESSVAHEMVPVVANEELPTVFINSDLRVMRYTPSAVGLFHFIPGDLGRPLKDLRSRLIYPELGADAEKVLQHLAPVEREVADHEGRFYLARILPYRADEDQIGGVVLTFVEITQRIRAEEALRQSETRLRLIVENAREFAIFSMDLDRRVTSWNIGAERLLGFQEKEIIGQSADIIFTSEDRAAGAPQDEAQCALQDERAVDERWHQRRDETRFWGSGYLMSMRDSAGRVIGFLKVLHDRTKGKEIENALAQSKMDLEVALNQAEQASRAKDEFLATLSHELRTPLTPVLLTAERLRRRKDLPPRVLEGLEMICRNVEIQAHLIDDLLDLTRIAHGKLELTKASFNVHEAIRGAIHICEPEIGAKGQELAVDLKATHQEIVGDAFRIQQVFWNLLKNGSRFTPEKGRIRVSSRNENGFILVAVEDTGTGIDPTLLPNIFDAFRQGDTSITRKHDGLGLGLTIAKAIVEAHGGTIEAESTGLNGGSTFIVRLPLERTVLR